MNTFKLPLSTLRAARLCTATKDIRYYLMGVHVDLTRGRVEATTGHYMLVLDGPRGMGQYIIPNATIDALLKTVGKRAAGNVTVTVEGKRVTLQHGYSTVGGELIDGTFPDCARVVPDTVTGEPAQYNPAYVMTITEALCAYRDVPFKPEADKGHHVNVRLEMNGNGPAVMHDGDVGAIALVMPRRSDALPNGVLADRLAWAKARS